MSTSAVALTNFALINFNEIVGSQLYRGLVHVITMARVTIFEALTRIGANEPTTIEYFGARGYWIFLSCRHR